MPLLEPSQTGFTIAGKATSGSASPGLTSTPGATSTNGRDQALGDVLVEARRERERVGSGVGEPQMLADRGNDRLASAAAAPLREVHDEIRPLAAQAPDQARVVLDRAGGVAEPRERRGHRGGHVRSVEFFEAIVVGGELAGG